VKRILILTNLFAVSSFTAVIHSFSVLLILIVKCLYATYFSV